MAKRYYWLKLNENFFEREEIKVIENMQNGEKYINFYLKLLLKSISNEGRLMFRNVIPYTPEMLASITNTDVDTVRFATELFNNLGLMDKLDDGALYMAETQNMIGSETEWAKKKRLQREKQNLLEEPQEDNVPLLSPNCPTEIDIDKEIDNSVSKDTISSNELNSIIDSWNNLNLTKLLNIKNNRLKLLKARVKEYGIEKVLEAIESIKESSFLKGQNSKGWIITFDWLVKPNNFTKVLEGNYIDKANQTTTNIGNVKKDEYAHDMSEIRGMLKG